MEESSCCYCTRQGDDAVSAELETMFFEKNYC